MLYKPSGKLFLNKKEAKQYFGTAYYHKIEKGKRDLQFIPNDNYIATDEYIQNYTPKITGQINQTKQLYNNKQDLIISTE